MIFHNHRMFVSAGVAAVGIVASACSGPAPRPPVARVMQDITVRAECLGDSDGNAENTWKCGEERTVECQERVAPDAVETLHVDVASCTTGDLSVDPGPYGLGSHDISVFARSAGPTPEAGQPDDSLDGAALADGAADAAAPICTARLTIRDTTPPEVQSHETELWPPNHGMHRLTVDDCVTATDACDGSVDVRFLWATVDEASDARGSGHTSPDIEFADCRTLDLRAERQGGGDGRVYEIGYRATDHSGNSTEGTCRVTVPHDQGRHHTAGGVAVSQVAAPGCK